MSGRSARKLLSAAHGVLTDAVICGQDGECVTAMAWLSPAHAGRVDNQGEPEESLRAELGDTKQRLTAEGGGSSQCVERMLVLTEPAPLDAGEITDNGYAQPGRRSRPPHRSRRPARCHTGLVRVVFRSAGGAVWQRLWIEHHAALTRRPVALVPSLPDGWRGLSVIVRNDGRSFPQAPRSGRRARGQPSPGSGTS